MSVGEVLEDTPAEIGRELGFPDALSTARAVRALIARRRLESAAGSYRLLDPPLEPAEREAIGRRPRGPRTGTPGAARRVQASLRDLREFGRRPTGSSTSAVRTRRCVVSSASPGRSSGGAGRDDAERRARALGERVAGLEQRADMAESNLRALLVAAEGAGRALGRGRGRRRDGGDPRRVEGRREDGTGRARIQPPTQSGVSRR